MQAVAGEGCGRNGRRQDVRRPPWHLACPAYPVLRPDCSPGWL